MTSNLEQALEEILLLKEEYLEGVQWTCKNCVSLMGWKYFTTASNIVDLREIPSPLELQLICDECIRKGEWCLPSYEEIK